MSTENSLVQIDQAGTVLQDFKPEHPFDKIYLDENDNVWGVFNPTFQTIKEKINRIWVKKKNKSTFEPFLLEGIPNHDLWNLARSKAGFWYIDYKQRIQLFSTSGKHLFDFHTLLGDKMETDFNYPLETENEMWFATSLGIIRTTSKTNPFQPIHKEIRLSDCRGITEDEEGNIYFSKNNIIYQRPSISKQVKKVMDRGAFYLQYHQGILFSGAYHLECLGAEIDLFKKTYREIPNLESSMAYTIQQSSNEDLFYIGHDLGITIWDTKQKQTIPFEKYQNFPLLKTSRVNHILKSRTNYWLATTNGVFLMNEKEGIIDHFCKKNGKLPFDNIRHIYEDKEKILWLSTIGNGVIRWDIKTKTYQEITTKNGLPNDYIYAIYEDDYNHFWIPSDNGLIRMNKSTFSINTYTTTDGLPHNEFNFSSHYKAKDGTLYFGSLGGLIAFHPKDVKNTNVNQIPLVFTRLEVLEEDAEVLTDKTKLLNESKDLIIQPTDKFIEIEFTLLDYEEPALHNYAYNIEGYTNNWVDIDENYIRITPLPYGNYTLKIKGRNASKGWSKNELALNIDVQKPIYLQWWFILSSVVIVIGLGIFWVKKREQDYIENQKILEKKVLKRTATIRQQAENLKKLDSLKSRFFDNVTHELKTPLTLISAPLQDVLKKEQLSKPLNKVLTNIHQNTQKLTHLLEELLTLSKMDHQQLELKEEKVTFYILIRRLIAAHNSYAQYRSIDLQLVYKPNQQLQILLDVKKMEKIVNNLLSNALKFTPAGGSIKTIVEDLGGQLKLIISDTGDGIHSNDLPYIFNRFFQSKQPGKSTEGGMGIGLALCNEYTKILEGTLSVESEWKKGSTFTLVFPKKEVFSQIVDIKPLATPLEEESPTLSNSTLQQNQKILVVEDNKEMADYIQSILEAQYIVKKVANGETALKSLKDYDAELIITDIMMPQMDGFQLLEAVKKQEKLMPIPFIMVTAKTKSLDRVHALNLGVDDYLTKPFLSEELVARVNNLLYNYNIRKSYIETTIKSTSFSFEDVPSANTLWLKELETVVKENIQNSNFNVTNLAYLMHVSESNLRNKIKLHTGLSPVKYLREARLNKARHLLENRRYATVAEVVYAIGMKHPANFTKMYKKRFGILPSYYFSKTHT